MPPNCLEILALGRPRIPPSTLIAAGRMVRGSPEPISRRGGEHIARGAAVRRVFLVDDNAADAHLVCEAIGDLPLGVDVSVAHDGETALAALRDAAQRGTLPDVIFLDLNLPRMSGHEVLAQLKVDPSLRHVPVVVLTSSSAQKDNDASYARCAADFITKPLDVFEYFALIRAAARRWLQLS